MSLINQWLGLVNGRLLSLRYKTLSKECKEINNGDVVSSIKLLQMALNRNWLITVESVTKFPRAKGLCFSYISISSRIVKVCDIQSLNNIIVWNSGHVTFLDKNIWIQRTVKAKSGLKTISVTPILKPNLCKKSLTLLIIGGWVIYFLFFFAESGLHYWWCETWNGL